MDTFSPPDPPLTDGELTIRAFRDDDDAALIAELQDPEIGRRTVIPHPYGEREAREFARRRARMEEAGVGTDLAIEVDGRLAGGIGIHDRDGPHALIGYWLARWARGRGIATRAVRLLGDWAFETLGLERIDIHVHRGNDRSERVAERAGYERAGTLRTDRGELTVFRREAAG